MKKALIIMANGFEEIEAITIIDILRRGGVKLTVAALSGEGAMGVHGVYTKADVSLDEVKDENYDMIILPGGGPGTKNLASSETVLTLVRRYKSEDRRIAAICAAPTVLAKAGVIDGLKVTSFPGMEDAFSPEYYSTENVVCSGLITTSRGAGTAMDFSLELLGQLAGEAKKDEISKQIVYR